MLQLLRTCFDRRTDARAFEIAVRRSIYERCVSVIVIPGDVALKPAANVSAPLPMGLVPGAVDCRAPLQNARQARRSPEHGPARHVALRCGCEGAHDELMQLAEALEGADRPRLASKEHVEWKNPYDVE